MYIKPDIKYEIKSCKFHFNKNLSQVGCSIQKHHNIMVVIISVDDPIKTFIVLDPLLLPSGRVVSVEEDGNLGVCNCLFKLQAFHKLPQCRVVARHKALKPLVPAFSSVGGSWKEDSFILVPGPVQVSDRKQKSLYTIQSMCSKYLK